jgi:NADH-quinone oxidoreductase subunit H
MKRVLIVLGAMAFAVGAIFLISGAAYGVGAWVNGEDSGWGRLTNILFLMLVFVMVIATLLTIAERKWSALMQDRIGPNRARLPGLPNHSLGGIPHLIADSLKMLTKEAFAPRQASRFLFELGPILSFAPVFALFAVVPVGPTLRVGGHAVAMVVATPDFGLLYIFAIASLAVFGTSLAGWSSNNKLALLGGVRASSQMISYEVALGLSLVGMMVIFSTVQLPTLTNGQAPYLWRLPGEFDVGLPRWGIFLQPLGFIGFFAAAFAETKRAPFDVPEGESEIIGYFVEYSGMKFGMFMISEFVEIVVLSGVTAAVFFGGYHLPLGEEWLGRMPLFGDHPWMWGALLATVFWMKVIMLCWLQLAIRWTFPRFRYDQIQRLGWKMLLPMGLANVFLSAALVLWDPTFHVLATVGLIEIGLILALTLTRGSSPTGDASPALARAQPAHPH